MPDVRGCLSDEQIADLFEPAVEASLVHSVAAHIDRCATCRRVVAAAARTAAAPTDPGDEEGEDVAERAPPLVPGSKVGRYVVMSCIGAGAMGVVYTARDPELGRKVALKLLRPEPNAGRGHKGRARLLREAQAMAQLAHPNVISIYDVGTAGEEVFLAMELVEGGTLSEWLGVRPHPWREVVDMLRGAGEGLAAAHAAGLVHRDFKPDNVLVGKDERARVTDFGLARAGETPADPTDNRDARPPELLASMTRTGTLVGTPAYMAPEQLAGATADARSDLFSFCVTLYEALYGERPFAAETVGDLRDAITRGATRRLSRTRQGSLVPAWLRRVVMRGLSASAAERPESMRALLDEMSAKRSRARLRTGLAASGALLAGIGVAAALVLDLRVRDGATKPVGSAPMAPTAGPTAMPDLPLPTSNNLEALQAYRRGLLKLRDGVTTGDDFERAAELDRTMAAAHLRYALTKFWERPDEARAHLAKAVEERDALTERDRLMLEAAQAWMQSQPADSAAFARLTEAAYARFPLDAELALNAGRGRFELGDMAGAIALFDRAIALDPGFGYAYWHKVQALSYSGDLAGSRATAELCILRLPDVPGCLTERMQLDQPDGRCDALEEGARQLTVRFPSLEAGYWNLALAAYSHDQPLEVVRELLQQRGARMSQSQRTSAELSDQWAFDVLTGDFDAARDHAADLDRSVAPDAGQQQHARAAIEWVLASAESGRLADAAQRARDFIRRKAAWVEEPRGEDFAIMRDPTPRLLLVERRAGLISSQAFEEQRRAWVDSWTARVIPFYAPYVWLHGYAAPAETSDDGARAMEELPKFGRAPVHTPYVLGDAYAGAAYFLAGRTDEALPLLRRAAHSCSALESPFEHTQAHLALGAVLATTGDREGACAAYGVVLQRWGHAKPRSVTAEDARKRAAALGCPGMR